MIEIRDNFLPKDDLESFYNFCLNAPWYYGERDAPHYEPTGLMTPLKKGDFWYDVFEEVFEENFQITQKVYRMYVNFFIPGEQPHFHKDGPPGQKTMLFYPNPYTDLDNGGETKFVINEEIRSIPPVTNRAILFDAHIWHSASSFRKDPRFTLAMKMR